METLNIPSWRVELSHAKAPALEIAAGQKVLLVFRDEGKEWKHPKYKDAVVFSVYVIGDQPRRWFVRSKRLLQQIYDLGPVLSGVRVEVEREGKGLETKYVLRKVE